MIKVQGTRAYIASTYPKRIEIVDISNPSAPRLLGVHPLVQYPVDMSLWGDYLAVVEKNSSSDGNLVLLDVSNPEQPRLVWRLDANAGDSYDYRRIALGNGVGYASMGTVLIKINMVQPESAYAQYAFPLPGAQAMSPLIRGETVFVPFAPQGLLAIIEPR